MLRGAAGGYEEEWLSARDAGVDAGAGGERSLLMDNIVISDNASRLQDILRPVGRITEMPDDRRSAEIVWLLRQLPAEGVGK